MVDHIAIILDGNRRYAKAKGKKPWQGHSEGYKKVRKVASWCRDRGINELTLYIFSTENFSRDPQEVEHIMDIFRKNFKKELIDNNKTIKVRFIGRKHLFEDKIQKIMKEVEEKTFGNNPFTLNLAMGYGGMQEITDAVKKIVSDNIAANKIDEPLIESYLYLNSKPDLVIRTGGAIRTSNFLLWQSSYSEWFFLEKMWPEFTEKDLDLVLEQFGSRKRNFGK